MVFMIKPVRYINDEFVGKMNHFKGKSGIVRGAAEAGVYDC